MKTSYGHKPYTYNTVTVLRDEHYDRVFQEVFRLLKWAKSLDIQSFARYITKRTMYVFLSFSCNWVYRNLVMLTTVLEELLWTFVVILVQPS